MELDDDHPLACGRVADDDIAQQSYLLAKIEERELMLHRIVANLIADAVVQIVHQPAFLNGENLVEGPSDVESDSRDILQTLALVVRQGGNLFLGQIAFIGTSEVELIAIGLRMNAAKNRVKLWQLHLSDAMQLVVDLLLLEAELLFVGQVLPLATAADTEVLTERSRAYLTIITKAHHLTLGEGVLLTAYLHVAHIARHAEGYEHHELVPVEQTFALGSYGLYRYALKER